MNSAPAGLWDPKFSFLVRSVFGLPLPLPHLPSSKNATRHATLKTYIYAPKATFGVFRTATTTNSGKKTEISR